MNAAGEPLRILLSREAMDGLAGEVARVLGARAYRLVATDDSDAMLVDVAFISRDITGLSTKHEVLPATQQVYDVLRAAPRLQWVQIHSAGADRPIYAELRERGVRVLPASGANATVVAQTALLGVLALGRHWPLLLEAQRAHRWAPLIASGQPRDLAGQTAVVVGWGPVGQEIGRLLGALGMQVVVVRRSAGADGAGPRMVAWSHFHEVLPQADWLVLACPLTGETRNLIGRDELALLAPHCCIVNVARGEVVDEPALIEALRARRIAGAYLDVFATEPLAADSPLWDLPNVIVTPHSAGFSDGNSGRVARLFLENLGKWVAGKL